jgi:hypothetical protein
VRVEFDDKSLVDMGPATRVWLRPTLKTAAGFVANSVYALGGWIKLAAAPGPGAGAAVESPTAKLLTRGSCVFESRGTTASVFCRSRRHACGVIEAWLKAEPSVRKALIPRWESNAREPTFKKALIDNMHHHPEWDRIVFPAKYQSKLNRATRAGLLLKQ